MPIWDSFKTLKSYQRDSKFYRVTECLSRYPVFSFGPIVYFNFRIKKEMSEHLEKN